jgi:hypothetical protein
MFMMNIQSLLLLLSILSPFLLRNLKVKKKADEKKKKLLADLLEKARSRPQSIYTLAQKLAKKVNKTGSILVTSPGGMYQVPFRETVETEAVLQLCANDWTDICIVHWFTM